MKELRRLRTRRLVVSILYCSRCTKPKLRRFYFSLYLRVDTTDDLEMDTTPYFLAVRRRQQDKTNSLFRTGDKLKDRSNFSFYRVKGNYVSLGIKNPWNKLGTHVKTPWRILALDNSHTKAILGTCKIFAWCTRQDVHEHTYFNYLGTTTQCAATTHHPAVRALYQPCRAPRLLATRLHGLYVNLVVRREYSSPGHNSSTSTTPYATVTSSSGCTTTLTTVSTSKLVENGFRGIDN
jgi:hypothetical protein